MLKSKSFATAAGAAALALGMWLTPVSMTGQPMYDRIHVELPYQVTLGDKVLQPGSYTIQQLPSSGGASRVLLFYTNNGMKFETSAMTIPTLDPNTATDTKLILSHVGDDYYINKIWVQGKDYGYELPEPKSLKERQGERSETTVAAQYEPSTAATNATAANTPPTNTDTTTQAQTTPPPQSTPVTSQTPPPPETSNTPAPQPATPSTNSADRSMADQNAAPAPAPAPAPTQMPNTAANWVMMLLGGGTLSGAGLMLRRKR